MDHFANLVGDYIYTRQFQEDVRHEDVKSVKLMHDLNEKRYRDSKAYQAIIDDIKRKAYGNKKELTK